jgi:hypothetical protein
MSPGRGPVMRADSPTPHPTAAVEEYGAGRLVSNPNGTHGPDSNLAP